MKTLLATATALVLTATALSAQGLPPNCAPYDLIVENMKKKWGESVVAQGINDRGGLFQLFANEETGTWTVITTQPSNMIGCMNASGENFTFMTTEPTPEGDPT